MNIRTCGREIRVQYNRTTPGLHLTEMYDWEFYLLFIMQYSTYVFQLWLIPVRELHDVRTYQVLVYCSVAAYKPLINTASVNYLVAV